MVLRAAKASGLSNLSKIADRDPDPAFAFRYLSESIRFDLGAEEKRGLRLFSKYLEKYNINLSPSKEITYF